MLRHDSWNEGDLPFIEEVGDPVNCDSIESGVTIDDLIDVAGGRVTVISGLGVTVEKLFDKREAFQEVHCGLNTLLLALLAEVTAPVHALVFVDMTFGDDVEEAVIDTVDLIADIVVEVGGVYLFFGKIAWIKNVYQHIQN